MLWLERNIRAQLTTMAADPGSFVRAVDIDRCIDWMLDDEAQTQYVDWVNADEYRGPGFSHGAWKMDWKTVDHDIDLYARRIRLRDADNARITSLDDWLREDLNATLAYSGHPGGTDLLADEMRGTLAKAARSREQRRPLLCYDCGEAFVRDRRNARRCPTCRTENTTRIRNSSAIDRHA